MPAPRAFVGASLLSPSILVIEDDEEDQATIARALNNVGYAVDTVSTGAQALVRCREKVFDAITLDLILPDTVGFEVLRGIRAIDGYRDVPIVVVTSVTDTSLVSGVSIHDCLEKPLNDVALLESLARAGVHSKGDAAVFVVDDDARALELMRGALRRIGYHAICFERADEALSAAHDASPDAVILDLIMPDIDGFEFLDRFRRIEGCGQTPVIVWTIKDLKSFERERLANAVAAIVAKGVAQGMDVVSELQSILKNRKPT
jgi:CheY-like chemotaxis protein